MQTTIDSTFQSLPHIKEAEKILRKCVHCGFCTAVCPTYQLLADEQDGPRGRIYLIKQLLEGKEVTEHTRDHLDRCLTCRSCETTCPSGVKYGRLLDFGRELLEQNLQRPKHQQLFRWTLRKLLPHKSRLRPFLRLGQLFRPALPSGMKKSVPPYQANSPWPASSHPRVMLALEGCVQSLATPNTLAAAARVMDKMGITLTVAQGSGCCGAVSHHLSEADESLQFIKQNIDAWWPAVDAGAEAILISASGCGAMVKEYGYLLQHDAEYADKASRISALARDLSEVIAAEDYGNLKLKPRSNRTAFHIPCTLQHGQQLNGVVEGILNNLGFELCRTEDKHLCCGSAGTYSMLQPKLSNQLRQNKLNALTVDNPDEIATANIGCQLHLGAESKIPVSHWIELVDRTLEP